MWGGLFGFLALIALVVYCRKKDLYCLQNEKIKLFFKKCCCGSDETDEAETKVIPIRHDENVMMTTV